MIKSFVKRIIPERVLVHMQAVDHYLNGEPELRLLPYLCNRERPSLDIGANVGTYAYFMRKYSSRVYAYEPNPMLCDRLRRLFSDVVVRHVAVSSSEGEVILQVPIEDGRVQHELSSVENLFEATTVERYAVPSIRIDDEGLDDVGFIKVDVEQHEIPVLKGCLETIQRCRPIIMSEVTPLLYPHPLPEMFRFVTALGYEAWFKFDGRYHSLKNFRPEVHANPQQWEQRLMGNNMIFIPIEGDSSFLKR